jgi:prophage regulatory protein
MKLIRLPEVSARTGRTRTRIYNDIEAGVFPTPVKIGDRAIAFVEAEVEDWIKAKIAAREGV